MYVLKTNQENYYVIDNRGYVLVKVRDALGPWREPNQETPQFQVLGYFDPLIGKEKGLIHEPRIGLKRLTLDRRVNEENESVGTIVSVKEADTLEEALTKITELQRREPRSP